jgi:hypothetical protein
MYPSRWARAFGGGGTQAPIRGGGGTRTPNAIRTTAGSSVISGRLGTMGCAGICWGNRKNGQLGNGTGTRIQTTPVNVGIHLPQATSTARNEQRSGIRTKLA